MRPLCRLLGISAQGYYKHDYASNEADILSASIVLYCLYVRQKERLPKAGCRELYTLCREYFREKFTIGRDRFYNVLLNPEKPDVPINKNDAFQKVQKRRVQEKR